MKALLFSMFLLLVAQSVAAINELDDYVKIPVFNSTEDALHAFNISVTVSDQILYRESAAYLKKNFTKTLRSKVIETLDQYVLLDLTQQNWIVEEIEIFYAVNRWIKAHPNSDKNLMRSLLFNAELILMNSEQLAKIVLPSGLYEAKKVLQALAFKAWDLDSKFERFPNQLAGSNILKKKYGAVVLTECSDSLIDDSSSSQDCYVKTTENGGGGLIVRSSYGALINYIDFETYDHGAGTVDVFNESGWVTVRNISDIYRENKVEFKPMRAEQIRLRFSSTSRTEIQVRSVRAYFRTLNC